MELVLRELLLIFDSLELSPESTGMATVRGVSKALYEPTGLLAILSNSSSTPTWVRSPPLFRGRLEDMMIQATFEPLKLA